MSTHVLKTEFAPAERVPIDVIQRQHGAVAASPPMPGLPDSPGDFVFVLNQQRQIVYASRNVQELLPDKSLNSILGMRPGEALDCPHARETEGGCGTTISCRECGMAKAILAALQGQQTLLECRLTRVIQLRATATDVLVRARPFMCQGQNYAIFSVSQRIPEAQ